ncbi:MAG: TIGR04086 family membrane protein [Lachnospiraceae bacterium]|nr:TIGR04086 family membrane protein [Lachnospiraceae bacterium]
MRNPVQYAGRALRIVKALFAAYIVTVLLLLLTAMLLYRFQLDEGKVQVAIIFTYILSCFMGGFLAGKMIRSRKCLWGVLLGLLYFVSLTLVSLAVTRELGSSGSGLATTFLLCMGGGMLGGMLS